MFFDDGILLVSAENPRGSTVFENLVSDPPTTEVQFVRLWKLYFLIITVKVLDEWKLSNQHSKNVRNILSDSGLIPSTWSLRNILKSS